FNNINEWYQEIKSITPDINLILVGNKIDLEDKKQVSSEEGEKLGKDMGISYIETSAKTGDNVGDAFRMLALELVKRFFTAEEV
ncbi:MAG: hypothetical protein KGD57_04955, partial [Candidatus Lokiarchaeota archaeon]|nr:hypothetical protein [Candidatus Lokiarchaeota archaeon]